ncbi:SDR family oxidoreductase [Paenibacillus sp. JCM 10914]
MKIVVTGATGKLGSLVIQHLLKRMPPSHIIAFVRNLDKATDLMKNGIDVRKGDYNEPETIRNALQDATKLLFISSPDSDDALRVVQHANVIKAARDAGIEHIAYTSFAFAENNPFAVVHMAAEYAIRAAKIPYTFLRNGGYSEFFINPLLQANVKSGKIMTNSNNGKVNSVSRDDLALAAATVLTEGGHENRGYNLVSNNPWSFDDLAQVISEVSGTPVIHQSVTFHEVKNALVQVGMSETYAAMTAGIYNTIAEGGMEKHTDDLHRLIGFETPIKEQVEKALQN